MTSSIYSLSSSDDFVSPSAFFLLSPALLYITCLLNSIVCFHLRFSYYLLVCSGCFKSLTLSYAICINLLCPIFYSLVPHILCTLVVFSMLLSVSTSTQYIILCLYIYTYIYFSCTAIDLAAKSSVAPQTSAVGSVFYILAYLIFTSLVDSIAFSHLLCFLIITLINKPYFFLKYYVLSFFLSFFLFLFIY